MKSAQHWIFSGNWRSKIPPSRISSQSRSLPHAARQGAAQGRQNVRVGGRDPPSVTNFWQARGGKPGCNRVPPKSCDGALQPGKLDASHRQARGSGRRAAFALPIIQQLGDENPIVAGFQDDLALVRGLLALALYQTGNPVEGVAEARKAVVIRQKLVQDDPTNTSRLAMLANDLITLGDAARSQGHSSDAKAAYEQALGNWSGYSVTSQKSATNRFAVSSDHTAPAPTVRDLGDPSGAALDVRRAL